MLPQIDVELNRKAYHPISFGTSHSGVGFIDIVSIAHFFFEVKLKLSLLHHSTLWLIYIALIARNLCYDFLYILAGIAHFLILEIS